WFGCIYDLAIGFLLFNRRTVNVAYFFVVVFHLATALFFNIGMFPYIMMTITVVFFRESFHERLLARLRWLVPGRRNFFARNLVRTRESMVHKVAVAVAAVYFVV